MKQILKYGTFLFIGCVWLNQILFAQGPNLEWVKCTEGIGFNYGYGVTTDKDGNVFITGFFTDTVDFDPGLGETILVSNGGTDIFILKLDSDGDFIWVRQIGGVNYDGFALDPSPFGFGFNLEGAVNVDSSGNVYTMGNFSGTVDFDPGSDTFNLTSIGEHDYFIQKMDTDGNFIWATSTDGYGAKSGIDLEGNIYTTGYFSGHTDFDPSPTDTFTILSHGNDDIFIQKLDADGNFVWVKQIGDIGMDRANSVAVDGSYVYTTGVFSTSTVDFDPGPDTTYLPGPRMFILKLDYDGNFIWAQNMGGHGSGETPRDIAVDANGNTFTIGYFGGTSGGTVFIQKLDSNGNYVWGKYITGNVGYSTPERHGLFISSDTKSNIYATGYFSETVDFDPGPGVYNVDTELPFAWVSTFFLNLDTDGDFVWAGKMDVGAFGLHSDSSDNVYITGTFGPDTVDFDPIPQDTFFVEGSGVFIAKFSPDSTVVVVRDNNIPQERLSVYPNPANSEVFLEFERHYTNIEIVVSSIEGKVLSRHIFKNERQVSFITTQYVPGTYLLMITCHDRNIEKQFKRKIVLLKTP